MGLEKTILRTKLSLIFINVFIIFSVIFVMFKEFNVKSDLTEQNDFETIECLLIIAVIGLIGSSIESPTTLLIFGAFLSTSIYHEMLFMVGHFGGNKVYSLRKLCIFLIKSLLIIPTYHLAIEIIMLNQKSHYSIVQLYNQQGRQYSAKMIRPTIEIENK